MKKLMLTAFLLISTGAFAQQFVIKLDKNQRPGAKAREMSRMELEERLRYLEQAVWELQMKVFKLESAPQTVEVVAPIRNRDKAWFCEIELFTERFEAWGPTELEARAKVVSDCSRQYFRSSCSKDKIRCEANK